MSTNIVFTVTGRNQTYMPIDINTTKEDILEKYARQSFSTENNWPFDSPTAGYYDVTNCSTKLILLNNQQKWSHLRGKTKEKREPFIKDQFYDWVEKEQEMSKARQQKLALGPAKRETNPDRHFMHLGCSYKVELSDDHLTSTNSKNASVNSSRPRTSVMKSRTELNKDEEEELLNYLISIGKRQTGLQDKTHHKKPPSEFTNSYNLNHPELRKGQRLYINDLCHIYASTPSKKAKHEQFLKLLQRQKDIDKKCREEFRYHNVEKFGTYRDFVATPRPTPSLVNCGYFTPKRVQTAPANGKNRSSSTAAAKSVEKKESSAEKETLNKNTNLSLDLHQLSKTANTSKESQSKSRSKTPSSIRSSLNSISSNSIPTDKNTNNTNDRPPRKGNKLSDLSSTDYDSTGK